MRSLAAAVLGLVVFACPHVVLASACNPDCTFKRGDANCSGAVTYADAEAVYYGTYTNADAADANDDGVISWQDVVMINNYVNYGGAAPPCPGPTTLGLDCTPDALENCCSPPTTRAYTLTHTCGDANVDKGTWDTDAENQFNFAGGCVGVGQVANNTLACAHDDAEGSMDILDIAVTDNAHFTKKRLQKGVQFAYLKVQAEVDFAEGDPCLPQYECEGSNLLLLDIHPENFYVEVSAQPAAGGGTATIQVDGFSYLGSYEYKLRMAAQCDIEILDDPDPDSWVSEPIDITSQLAGIATTDCDPWKITEVNVHDAKMYFIANGNDITTNETVDVTLTAWVYYDWCECE